MNKSIDFRPIGVNTNPMRYIKIFGLDSNSFSVHFFRNTPATLLTEEKKENVASFKFYNWIENGDHLTRAITDWIGNGVLPDKVKGLELLPRVGAKMV